MIDVSARHPAVCGIVRLLDSQHLTGDLATVSSIFERAAAELLVALPDDGPQLTSALRGLWEAKNDAVGHAVLCRDLEQGAPPVTIVPGEQAVR